MLQEVGAQRREAVEVALDARDRVGLALGHRRAGGRARGGEGTGERDGGHAHARHAVHGASRLRGCAVREARPARGQARVVT